MIKVLFICGNYKDNFNEIFGGSPMEYYSLNQAFENHPEIQFTICDKFKIENYPRYRKEYDIIHCENMPALKNLMYVKNYIPDVLGPTIRSPTKNEIVYNEDKEYVNFYYKATIIRNNSSEENIPGYCKKIKYISLGVNTDKLKFVNYKTRPFILWVGDATRKAKNIQMFIDVMNITKLPHGYRWKIMSDYSPEKYWKTLQKTYLVINTSGWETFCFTMFEAESVGIPVIYKKGLHNSGQNKMGFHVNNRIQIDYTPKAYKNMILKMLNDGKLYWAERKFAREYTVKNASYENIRQSFGAVYKEIYKKKHEV